MRWWIAMAATILVTTPGLAQRQGPPAPAPIRADSGYAPTTGDIHRDINQARDAGRLSRADARRASGENGVTGSLAERYASDGRLSDDEQREIDNRNAAMRSILNAPATRSRAR
jgi:hypothetical protein